MKLNSRITPYQYTIFITVLVILFLLLVKLTPDSLPFPPQGEFSDVVVSHWPNALYLQASLRGGHFPHWRNLLMSGQPFAANPLNKVWYPPQWLVAVLPATFHLNLMLALHLILAGIAMGAFCLRIGLSPESAAIAGIAYALTPRLVAAAGAGHLDIVYAAAWFPAVLWAIHRLIAQPNRQHIALTSLICAMCFLADMRLSIFILSTGIAFGIWFSWQSTENIETSGDSPLRLRGGVRGGVVLSALAIIVLFLAMTAIQWLPLLQLTRYLSRTGLTADDAAILSLQPAQLLGLVLSDRGGSHETMVYVGISVLILAAISLLQKRRWFWIAVIIVCTLYALGSNGFLWSLLIKLVPPLLWLRVPSRIWIIVAFVLIVLAGYGIDALRDRGVQRRIVNLLGVVLISLGATCGLFSGTIPVRPGAAITAAIGLIVMALVLLLSRRLTVRQISAAIASVIILDLAWMGTSLIEGRNKSEWLDKYEPIARTLQTANVTRLYSPDYSFPQQAAAYWHIPQFGGVDPFQLRDYIPEFEAATGTRISRYSITLPPFEGDMKMANQNAVIDAERLAAWNVSHVLAGYPIESDDLKLVENTPDGLFLYENTYATQQDRSIIWETPNTVRAKNNSDSPLNVAIQVPGWSVSGDDAVIVAPPQQTITAQYETPGFIPGLSFSIGAFLLSIALLFGKNRYP